MDEQLEIFEKKTKVVHKNKETYDVYIGRPSKWGNPFSHKEDTLAKFKVKNRDESIEKYREWVYNNPDLMREIKNELSGKTLGCWCKPKKCHGDILAEIADTK